VADVGNGGGVFPWLLHRLRIFGKAGKLVDMSRNWWAAILLGVIAVSFLPAGDLERSTAGSGESSAPSLGGKEDEIAAEVTSLVERLDAPNLADRQEAERRLLELGPAVLEVLPGPHEVVSSEARVRLQRVREKLLVELGRQMLQPSSVSLPEGTRIADAFRQISLQSGNPLWVNFGEEGARLKAEEIGLARPMDRQTFWKCFDQLLTAGGLSASFVPGENRIELSLFSPAGIPLKRPVSYSGPFRLEIVRFLLADSEGSPKTREITLWIRMAWEPRLRPIVLYWLGDKFEAESAAGRMLQAAPGERTREVQPMHGRFFVELPIRLRAEEVPGHSLKVVRGSFVALFPGPEVTFAFGLQEPAPQIHREGDATVIFEGISVFNDRIQARLRAAYGQPFTAFESHRGWFYDYLPKARLPEGEELAPLRIEPILQLPNQVALAVDLPILTGGERIKLLWKIPAAILREEFAIEFRDVPLNVEAGEKN